MDMSTLSEVTYGDKESLDRWLVENQRQQTAENAVDRHGTSRWLRILGQLRGQMRCDAVLYQFDAHGPAEVNDAPL